MGFEVVGEISDVETVAEGTGVRIRSMLDKVHGKGRWRKLKGVARVRVEDGTIRPAELHWFEAHGVGRRRMRIKAFLD